MTFLELHQLCGRVNAEAYPHGEATSRGDLPAGRKWQDVYCAYTWLESFLPHLTEAQVRDEMGEIARRLAAEHFTRPPFFSVWRGTADATVTLQGASWQHFPANWTPPHPSP